VVEEAHVKAEVDRVGLLPFEVGVRMTVHRRGVLIIIGVERSFLDGHHGALRVEHVALETIAGLGGDIVDPFLMNPMPDIVTSRYGPDRQDALVGTIAKLVTAVDTPVEVDAPQLLIGIGQGEIS